ncbi:DUF4062 domain-containing protein [Novosphingobium subterraneum]|uniref:DUF4062 domain-containing protein n=1 Tax=Novosphingobium subterraneum TaxID=48936 RepID=UPI003CFDBB98
MAKPRVFISSTYYDLRSLRGELERFVREQGYEPILNERGHIAYSKDAPPEISCYREIENCDILVSIVGGRFGSTSFDGISSISQIELKTALEQSKQVYIFVEKDVLSEYRFYQNNKDVTSSLKWSSVDDTKIFDFLEEMFNLDNNNAIMPFETGQDIVFLLREQWAGLFQRILQNQAATNALDTARELRRGLETARQLIDLLKDSTTDNPSRDAEIKAITLPSHPSFSRIQRVMKVPYRVYFTNIDELNTWLKARSFEPVAESAWDNKNYREWIHGKKEKVYDILKVYTELFNENGLFIPDQIDWNNSLIKRESRPTDEFIALFDEEK